MMPARRRLDGLLDLWLVVSLLLAVEARVLSSAGALGAKFICSEIPGLSPRQRVICQNHPKAIVALGDGAEIGLLECQRQFSGMQWNCTSRLANKSLFGHYHVSGSREAAYSDAITSAAVAYAITQGCFKGTLGNSCGCDKSKRRGHGFTGSQQFTWGSCSADWKHGSRFAKRFLDVEETELTARALMNNHNNQAGRKALKNSLMLKCKCHGLSGSCNVQTCWNALPPFKSIGTHLMTKYRKAKKVVPIHGSRARRPIDLKLKRSRSSYKKPRHGDLVYLHQSPNYCKPNNHYGILGTQGRQCWTNISDNKPNSCDLLCCGRGHTYRQFVQTKRCNCKFVWCCEVKCDWCEEQHVVNACQ